MIDAVLFVCVIGAVVLAIGVDIGMILAWVRKRP
jgi:hypothetical protein